MSVPTIETSPFVAGTQSDSQTNFGRYFGSSGEFRDELAKVLGSAVIYNANVIRVLLGKAGGRSTDPRPMDDDTVISTIVQRVSEDCKDDITLIGNAQNFTYRSVTSQPRPEAAMYKPLVRYPCLVHQVGLTAMVGECLSQNRRCVSGACKCGPQQ